MAQQVWVENYGNDAYTEEFNGKSITIGKKARIRMGRREAVLFLSQMSGKDGSGHIKEKKLRIVNKDREQEKEKFVCNYDGRMFNKKEQLDAHLEELREKGIKNVVKDDNGNLSEVDL